MNFDVLKRSHLKRNILIAVLVVALISSLILNFTQAKYRTTQSIPLIQGTINFSPSDLNLMAVYLNKNGETLSSDKVPHVGYTLNEEESICEVNGKDTGGKIVYEDGNLSFMNINYKGTKCSVYFDLIPHSEVPTINEMTARSLDEESITITVDSTDNIGVFYYYYKLDDGEEIQSEDSTYTFDGLIKDQKYTISVRVEDAAGNSSSSKSNTVIAGYSASMYILTSVNPPTGQTTDWTGKTTYYYTGDPNNWIQFAGFYWRIIRINGDGSIRVIYQGRSAIASGPETQIDYSVFHNSANDNMYVGYMYQSGQLHGLQNSSSIKGILDRWYTNNIANKGYGEYVAGNAGFCGDRRTNSGSGTGTDWTYYQANIRIMENEKADLGCDNSDIYTTNESSTGNKALSQPIGLISADEALLGGLPWNINNDTYLYTGQNYWTMTPSYFGSIANVFFITDEGHIGHWFVNVSYGVRPVINIRSDVQLIGTGTTTDPYRLAE